MTRKPRQDFSVSKVRFSHFLWLCMGHNQKRKWALLLHSNGDMWHSLNKIKRKEKSLFLKTKKQLSLSSLSPTFSEALSSLPHVAFSFSFIHYWSSKQSSNLWPSFLLQIAKGGHFRSREAHLYVWDFEISGLGRHLSLLIFVGMGFCEI